MSSIFSAVVVACVQLGALQVCDTLQSPIPYVTEQRCAGQGAILAGMFKSHFGSAARLSYRVACVPVHGNAEPRPVERTAQAAEPAPRSTVE